MGERPLKRKKAKRVEKKAPKGYTCYSTRVRVCGGTGGMFLSWCYYTGRGLGNGSAVRAGVIRERITTVITAAK